MSELKEMSVEALLKLWRVPLGHICLDDVTPEEFETELKSALRSAVIREASVGTVSIKHHSTDKAGYPLVDKLTMKEVMPNAWMDYDLIPKETT